MLWEVYVTRFEEAFGQYRRGRRRAAQRMEKPDAEFRAGAVRELSASASCDDPSAPSSG
jgi:hypothetical protein